MKRALLVLMDREFITWAYFCIAGIVLWVSDISAGVAREFDRVGDPQTVSLAVRWGFVAAGFVSLISHDHWWRGVVVIPLAAYLVFSVFWMTSTGNYFATFLVGTAILDRLYMLYEDDVRRRL